MSGWLPAVRMLTMDAPRLVRRCHDNQAHTGSLQREQVWLQCFWVSVSGRQGNNEHSKPSHSKNVVLTLQCRNFCQGCYMLIIYWPLACVFNELRGSLYAQHLRPASHLITACRGGQFYPAESAGPSVSLHIGRLCRVS